MDARQVLSDLRERVEEEYRRRTPKSGALHRRAGEVLPGGDTRTGTVFAPYPIYFDYGEGSYLYDVDGNRFLDFTNNATSLIHGHAHPAVVDAVRRQAGRGTAWAAPNRHQVRLGEMLCARLPGLDRVRFCNSGTEANMQAIKAARAFSGKDRILMMDGAYHGTYDGIEFHLQVPEGGEDGLTNGIVPSNLGIPRNEKENVLLAPFNDGETAARLIAQHHDDLAAVIVTPIMTRGRLDLPAEGYLPLLRETTREYDVLLIFDEVITYRVSAGGAQEHYGVVPDLTALGKIIGGGLPVGAFGGRPDVMELFEGRRSPSISHAGTFNGNPLTMVAGLASLELLTPSAYEGLAEMGGLLRDRMKERMADVGSPLLVSHVASLLSVDLGIGAFGGRLLRGDRSAALASELLRLIQLALLNRGIKSYSIFAISTVTGETEIERAADTFADVLIEFEPAVEAVLNRIAESNEDGHPNASPGD